METINTCPCGKTPNKLIINCPERGKWGYVSGDCCGEWMIEFRNQYAKLDSTESNNAARDAWNGAPRPPKAPELSELIANL